MADRVTTEPIQPEPWMLTVATEMLKFIKAVGDAECGAPHCRTCDLTPENQLLAYQLGEHDPRHRALQTQAWELFPEMTGLFYLFLAPD